MLILVLGRDLTLEARPGDLRSLLYMCDWHSYDQGATRLRMHSHHFHKLTTGILQGVVSWFLGIRVS